MEVIDPLFRNLLSRKICTSQMMVGI